MPGMKRNCRLTGKEFVVTEWEQEFFGKMGIPLPTLCPEESHRRRLAYRNERKIYKDTCDLTGKSMISLYSPEKDFKVYSQEAWWSDKWDPRDFGRDYDFNRPFFEQFRELQRVVPRLSLLNTKGENSEYCSYTTSNRNCYLVFGGDFNEDCMYSVFCFHSRDSSDLYWVNRSELCYECSDCNDLYNCRFCAHAYNCRDCAFLYDCRGCSNCFGCVGLNHKQYYFFNKEYSKEEYESHVAAYNLKTNSGLKRAKEDFLKFKLERPHRSNFVINCENCSGNDLVNCKNCTNCFDVEGPAEDLKDVLIAGWNLHDALRCNHIGHGADNVYEISSTATASNCYFGAMNWYSNNLMYCEMAVNSCHDLFGCTNMKKAEYCILNKQYSKEQYFDLVPRIIRHMGGKVASPQGERAGERGSGYASSSEVELKNKEWGEFFPIQNSPFCYNETIAQDYLPLDRKAALSMGLKWLDEEVQKKGSGEKVPDSIDNVDESICDKTFVCVETGRPYKVNETELKLYKKLGVPIPYFAPETRNVARYNSRNPWKTWMRKCAKCNMEISTSYAPASSAGGPARPEKVYCEKCYLEFVV